MSESADRIGWGLVGPGRHARLVAPAFALTTNGELRGVVGRELPAAEALAESVDARAYPSLEAMLGDPRIRAVYIVTPYDLHVSQTLTAAAAGRHVLCEKPMALTPADCRAMIAACRASGVKLGLGFHLRQHPAHRRARDLVGSDVLGGLQLVRGQWAIRTSPIAAQSGWRQPERAKAGILYGTGLHIIDLMRFALRREVEAVSAWTDARPDRLDSRVLALLRFSGGLEATLVAALGLGQPDNDLVMHGLDGRLAARDTLSTRLSGSLEIATADQVQRWEYPDEQPELRLYIDEFERFGRAIIEDSEPDASGRDGLAAMLVAEAIQRSAAEGRTLAVESPES